MRLDKSIRLLAMGEERGAVGGGSGRVKPSRNDKDPPALRCFSINRGTHGRVFALIPTAMAANVSRFRKSREEQIKRRGGVAPRGSITLFDRNFKRPGDPERTSGWGSPRGLR